MRGLSAFIRETIVSAWNSPVGSLLTIVMVAGMCVTVILTSGRTVGAQDAVLRSIDSVGTRSLVIRADDDAGLTSSFLTRVASIDGVTATIGFGQAADVRNQKIPGGTKVSSRDVYGSSLDMLGANSVLPGRAWASRDALELLGMDSAAGAVVRDSSQESFAVVGTVQSTQYLNFLNPLVVVPRVLDQEEAVPLAIVVIVTSHPTLLAAVKSAVQPLLGVQDPTKVRIETSQNLADLRGLVQEQLGVMGHSLVVGVLGLSSVLIAAILYGVVLLRRKDFGRRRALGATRTLIVSLVMAQTLLTSCIGAVLGSGVGSITLKSSGDPLPRWDYLVATAILGVTVGLAASVLPAMLASRRDPIGELRVP